MLSLSNPPASKLLLVWMQLPPGVGRRVGIQDRPSFPSLQSRDPTAQEREFQATDSSNKRSVLGLLNKTLGGACRKGSNVRSYRCGGSLEEFWGWIEGVRDLLLEKGEEKGTPCGE